MYQVKFSTIVAALFTVVTLLSGCGLLNKSSDTTTAATTQSNTHKFISTDSFIGTVDSVTSIPGTTTSCILSVHDDTGAKCNVYVNIDVATGMTEMQAGLTAKTLTTPGSRLQFYVSKCNSECPTGAVDFTAEVVASAGPVASPTPTPTVAPAGTPFIAGTFSVGTYSTAGAFTSATAPLSLTFDHPATDGKAFGGGTFVSGTGATAVTCKFTCAPANGTDFSGNTGAVVVNISAIALVTGPTGATNASCVLPAGDYLIYPQENPNDKTFAGWNQLSCRAPGSGTATILERTK